MARKMTKGERMIQEFKERQKAVENQDYWKDFPQPDPAKPSTSWPDPLGLVLNAVQSVVRARDDAREDPKASYGEATRVEQAVSGAWLRDAEGGIRLLPAVLRYFRTALLRVELLEAEAVWHPLSTAPKDGRDILVCDPAKPRPIIARYVAADEQTPKGRWVLSADFFMDPVFMDTWVWRDVPRPPAPELVEGGAA